MRFQRFILYLTIIAAFAHTLWGSMQVGQFHMFPFRWMLLAMWSILALNLMRNRGRLDISFCRVAGHLRFLIFWLVFASLSVIWAADKAMALRYIIFIFIGVSLVIFTVYYYRRLDHIRHLLWLWLLIFTALIPVGVWEVITGHHLSVSAYFEESQSWVACMPSAVFHNTNDFAMFLSLSLVMILSVIWHCRNLIVRAVGIPVFGAGLWLLILTKSRACYIAFLIGLFFWFIFLLKTNKKITALIVTTGLCALVIVAFPEKTIDIVQVVEREAVSLTPSEIEITGDGSLSGRLNLIKNALYFTVQSFGVGVGAGNADYYMEYNSQFPVEGITNVHNWWVEILANFGVYVFVGYLIFYASIFENLWSIRRRAYDRTELMICDALLVGWVSFAFASISSSSIVALPFQWIYCGMILAFMNYWRNKQRESI